MERELLIIRHGKSSWDDTTLDDFDRPLAPRGLRAAADMARRIMDRKQVPGLVFSSPALRARHTAEIMMEAWGLGQASLVLQDEIYEASVLDLDQVVARAPKSLRRLALFGHNPSFTYYANVFLSRPLGNLPTAGVVWIRLESAGWDALDQANVLDAQVDFPKKPYKG